MKLAKSRILQYFETKSNRVTMKMDVSYTDHSHIIGKVIQNEYRVIQQVSDLGWVDLDLGSSLGWWAATVATYCPSRPGELPKSN